MSRTNAVLLALLLGFNAVVATVALMRTLNLGHSSHAASSALVAKRTAQLDKFEASLKAQLAKKPPPLPKKPSPATYAAASSTSAPQTTGVPQVRYVRPAPIVIHKHRAGGEHEGPEAAGGFGETGDD